MYFSKFALMQITATNRLHQFASLNVTLELNLSVVRYSNHARLNVQINGELYLKWDIHTILKRGVSCQKANLKSCEHMNIATSTARSTM